MKIPNSLSDLLDTPPAWIKYLALTGLLALSSGVLALGDKPYITATASDHQFPLVSKQNRAKLYVDSEDYQGLKRAVGDLQEDINKVTGQRPALVHDAQQLGEQAVIIGSLEKSRLIQRLVAEGKLDVEAITDQWDAFHMESLSHPLPGVKQALVIAGSNMRGAIYGVYDLSEQIGVSPWYWWADVPVKKQPRLYVDSGLRRQDWPRVKYRGIFLNDEYPALTQWVQEKFGGYNHKFYVKVFELLLRLKANYLWPAMWNNAFADDDPKNMILADEYGIVMGTSHHEPLMRADKEWNRYGKGPWSYSKNAENLYNFWLEGVKRNKNYESIYTLGMRGQEDRALPEGQDIELMEKIVSDQRDILKKVFDKDITQVPQVWALYKEVQGFYEKGMRVPEDVILLWSDDNWGNIRRLPTPEERKRPGGAGVYYHFDYVGGPRSYRWINTVPIAKIWEQMNLAYRYQADKIWIANVGDLKPMEYPIEFFLRMAWNPEEWPKERLPEFGRLWAEREFGPEHAETIARIMTTYTRHNGRRKPELQSPDTYSLVNYREAARIEAELDRMVEDAEAIYRQLDKRKRAAFYQLVLYPAKASATVTKLYIETARNRLYAQQGRANAREYANRARGLFEQDAELEDYFHNQLSDGKWNYMMAQPRIGYTHWNNPPANTMPVTYHYEPHGEADMGVAVEAMTVAWPSENVAESWPYDGSYRLPEFSPYGRASRSIEVYNRGTRPFEFEASASEPWIQLSQTSGQVEELQTLEVRIDWELAPHGQSQGQVRITGTGWGGANIGVRAFNPDPQQHPKPRGFIEADGYVSIEAAHFSSRKAAKGVNWEEIPQLGRTLSAISTFPVNDRHFEKLDKAPYVEYEIYFFSKGEFEITGYFAPTQKFMPDYGLRYGIGFAGTGFEQEEPQVVDILADYDHSDWQESVRRGVHTKTSRHTIKEPGLHKLRVYRVDPGVTLQKLVIDTGGLRPSYLGPPESENINRQ